jgi:hypothetical protein
MRSSITGSRIFTPGNTPGNTPGGPSTTPQGNSNIRYNKIGGNNYTPG